ncbi:MAG: hypothetical protein NDI94_05110 [Candidatus Woesearchaeota archaeon]|nr:hypothetical protein [Candidatus Woesearchaeota archaeon]
MLKQRITSSKTTYDLVFDENLTADLFFDSSRFDDSELEYRIGTLTRLNDSKKLSLFISMANERNALALSIYYSYPGEQDVREYVARSDIGAYFFYNNPRRSLKFFRYFDIPDEFHATNYWFGKMDVDHFERGKGFGGALIEIGQNFLQAVDGHHIVSFVDQGNYIKDRLLSSGYMELHKRRYPAISNSSMNAGFFDAFSGLSFTLKEQTWAMKYYFR